MVVSRLKFYREQKNAEVEFNLSRAHLARQIDVSRSYITKVENGEIIPHLEKAHKLANYFNCTVDELFPFVTQKTD